MTQARDLVDQFNNNGFHHIETKSVTSGSAGADVFYFANAFSSDFTLYYAKYKIQCPAHSLGIEAVGFQFGNSGSVDSSGKESETGVAFTRSNTSSVGGVVYHVDNGVIMMGNTVGTNATTYIGYINIANPVSSSIDTTWFGLGNFSEDDQANKNFNEEYGGRTVVGDTFGATDIVFRVFGASAIDQAGTTFDAASTQQSVFGTVAIYGCKGF